MGEQELWSPQAKALARQYQTLLEVSEAIASHRDLNRLFRDLAPRLHGVVHFDFVNLILDEPAQKTMRSHVLECPDPNYTCPPQDCPMEAPARWVWQMQQPWVVSALERDGRFPEVTQWLTDRGIQSLCVLPITTALRRLGALAFGSTREAAYSEPDVEFLQQVAKQVAVAVDNALNFDHVQSTQQQLKEERDRLSLLLEVNNAVVSALNLRELLKAVSSSLQRVVRIEYASLSLYDPETDRLQIHALDFPASKGLLQEGQSVPVADHPAGHALTSRQPVFLTRHDVEQFQSEVARRALAEGIKSACCLPLISHGRPLGTLVVASLREETFPRKDADLLQHVANQIAIAVENALAFGQVVDLANKLTEEKRFLEEEIKTEYDFEEIVGQSAALKRVLKQAETVAPTDSTILILGETGTGKEFIARAIHNLSGRKERAFVKVNCAAIPTGLLESELFGHEKGAFTGAIAQKVGRFELAHQGTLFLDEVGDIPLELQPKLLCVLQEQEFERLGSTKTIRVNVRLIAATNANLAQMVAEKKFRSDLYYRLNVFPILMPPLRERPEDVPLLVRYFAQKYARLVKKEVRTVPAEVISALTRYRWPGNIRELENFIERAVILSPGPELRVPVAELKPEAEGASRGATTLEAAEREHILRVLRQTNWVIGGPSGAAARLGMKRTTLQSRMIKLGITRPK
ncbi:MAG: sigma 54-interacting transcriptional regulator [Deltaproteobacteria bacterium]|nr:sigma 54-interacting transcriptional regulator [Deltaproteobacteria bacterium]